MDSAPLSPTVRRADLFVSAEQVSTGQSLSLSWSVTGLDTTVLSVQLASASGNGLEVIESIPNRGSRQMIFARPGLFTFTLTAIFQDGLRRSKQIQVQVVG